MNGRGVQDIQPTCHMCTLYLAQMTKRSSSLNHKMAALPKPLGAQTIDLNGLRTAKNTLLCHSIDGQVEVLGGRAQKMCSGGM